MKFAYKEHTTWNGFGDNINHIYLIDSDKMFAYIPNGSNKAIWFKEPIRINLRGRQLKQLKDNPFEVTQDTNTVVVTGSKGELYHIDPVEKTCTCMGFKYRGQCKHIIEHKNLFDAVPLI